MNSIEKADIYDLLKKASSSVLGYEAKGFGDIVFEDDVELDSPSSVGGPVESSENPLSQKNGATLESVYKKILGCRNCQLSATRTNAVPGEGVENPLVMVIGEGPGEDEDKTGRPFVGKAGQLLDKMLGAIGLDRNRNCYIANIVKCRPPNNRAPFPQESTACSGFLQAQIHILKPSAILAMGRTAAQCLLDTGEGIGSLHGRIMEFNGIPFMATYHPSALLRNEDLKRPAWNDLKLFRDVLSDICPGYDK